MNELVTKRYTAAMLPDVDYNKLEDGIFSLTDLEYDTMESCADFLDELKAVLLEEQFNPVPEFLVAHLCAYLGAILTIHKVIAAESLTAQTVQLVEQQAKIAYQHFCEYPINDTVKTREEQLHNFNKLRETTPGSIVNQTVRLERKIIELLEALKYCWPGADLPINKRDPQILCSHETLTKMILLLGSKKCAFWRKRLHGLSDNYVINQLAIQIGWLIGYLTYLSTRTLEQAQYLDYGIPVIQLYQDFIFKLMKSYAEAQQDGVDAEEDGAEKLLAEVQRLAAKTQAQTPGDITEFQKQYRIVHAGIEKSLLELLQQQSSLKIMFASVFYFWFILAAPLYNRKLESAQIADPLVHLPEIIHLLRKTAQGLPKANPTPDVVVLNEKMQQLRQYIPSPEKLEQAEIVAQTARVNGAIHAITSEYLQQNIHPEAVANALFCHLLRLSVFFGLSEQDWQKMDYYIIDVLKVVKQYVSGIRI